MGNQDQPGGVYSLPSEQRTERTKTSKPERTRRSRAEAKHTFQYFLLRQKTAPVIENKAEIIITRLKKGRS